MSDTSLLFDLLGRDRVSSVIDKVATRFAELPSHMKKVGRDLASEAKSAGMIAGAELAGALGAGVAGIGAGAMFIGIAVAAQKSNVAVAESFSGLAQDIKASTTEASSVLADDFVKSADQLGASFDRLQPQMAGAFAAMEGPVASLTGGVTDLAENAMPGIVLAAQRAGPVFDGLGSTLASTGRGVSAFFENASTGSEASGQAFRDFGYIIEDFSGFAGSLLASMANGSGTVIPAFGGALRATEGAVLALSDTAMPGLASGAASVLTLFGGLVSAVGPLITALGPLVPMATTVALSMKLIDMVSFGAVTKNLGDVKTRMGEASTAGGKLKVGAGALASAAFGPLGIAVAAVGIGLTVLGADQEAAARAAQQHRNRVDDLAEALRRSNGVIDENVRVTAMKALAEAKTVSSGKSLIAVAQDLGMPLERVNSALVGDMQALEELAPALDEHVRRQEAQITSGSSVADIMNLQGEGATALRNALFGGNVEINKAIEQNKNLALAQQSAAGATGNHTTAVLALQDAILASVDKNLAYRQALVATQTAQQGAAKAVRDHGAQSTEARDALLGLESAQLRQVQSAKDQAMANSTATSDAGKLAEAQRVAAQEIVNLALASNGQATPALRQMLGSMDASTLSAYGLRNAADAAGNRIISLPNGKTITLTPADLVSPKAQEIANRDWYATITLVPNAQGIYKYMGQIGQGKIGSGRMTASTGGYITGPGTGTSDSIPMSLSNGEYVINAAATRQHRAVLEAINHGGKVSRSASAASAVAGAGASGGAGGGYATIEIVSGGSELDELLVKVLQRSIRGKGGNVQVVLGSR